MTTQAIVGNQNQPTTLYAEIVSILAKNSPETLMVKINTFDFETIGIISYLHGMEFVNQRLTGSINREILETVHKRLTSHKIEDEVLHDCYDIIQSWSYDDIQIAKDKFVTGKNDINNVAFDTNDFIQIKLIDSILNDLIIGFEYSARVVELNTAIKANRISYHDLLNINSLIYELSDLTGKAIPEIVKLQSYDKYQKSLKKAATLFENQKYSVIYLDMIISLKEYFEEKPERTNWIDAITNDVMFNELGIEENIATELVSKNNEINQSEIKEFEDSIWTRLTEINPKINKDTVMDFPDYSIAMFLIQNSINTGKPYWTLESIATEDYMQMIFDLRNNEDIIGDIYKYLIVNIGKNRQNISELLPNINVEELSVMLTDHISALGGRYKSLMENFLIEIPSMIIESIIKPGIHKTIKSGLLITDSNIKPYIIQQYVDTDIKTFKQLYQVINLFEKCSGSKTSLIAFGAMIDELKAYTDANNFGDIINSNFENAELLEPLELELNFYTNFKKFFAGE